eukprot:scaffold45364_cov86-Phaeocystis_antarctica.AAC.3
MNTACLETDRQADGGNNAVFVLRIHSGRTAAAAAVLATSAAATASSDSEPILFEQRVYQMRCLKTSRNLVRAHAFGHLCNTGDCCRHGR